MRRLGRAFAGGVLVVALAAGCAADPDCGEPVTTIDDPTMSDTYRLAMERFHDRLDLMTELQLIAGPATLPWDGNNGYGWTAANCPGDRYQFMVDRSIRVASDSTAFDQAGLANELAAALDQRGYDVGVAAVGESGALAVVATSDGERVAASLQPSSFVMLHISTPCFAGKATTINQEGWNRGTWHPAADGSPYLPEERYTP